MQWPFLPWSVFICLIATESRAAVSSTPQISFSLVQPDLVPHGTFTSGGPGSSYSRIDTANENGGTTTIVEGSYQSSGTRTSQSAPGSGGTLTWNQSSSLNAMWDWGQATSQNGWSFYSSFEFQSSLEYQASSVTSGGFFFVLNPTNTNAFSLERQVTIEVDRPLSIHLAISAVFTKTSLPDAQLFAMTLGGPPDWPYYAEVPVIGQDGSTSGSLSDSYGNVSFSGSGRRTADGLVYDLLISPVAEGLSETVELHWLTDYTSRLSGVGANRLTLDLDDSGTISESFTIMVVPEPSSSLATMAGLGFVIRRRRQAASA